MKKINCTSRSPESGIPMEIAEWEREERKERDRQEAERLRQAGYELARGPVRSAEQLMSEFEMDQLNETKEEL